MIIGTTIIDLLTASAALIALVPATSIFPVVAEVDTHAPFLVYKYSVNDVDYNKDGWDKDDCSFGILVVSGDYGNLQSILVQVRAALEMKRITGTQRIQVLNIEEPLWLEDMYVQKINFSVTINKY